MATTKANKRQDRSAGRSCKGKTGAQIFHEMLLGEGVERMFGIVGGAMLPIFDVLHGSPIPFVLTRHEQGAAHMADGYARSTGKVGVCIATSGPGATNLTTGLATAYMDSSPVVAFTGQVKTFLIGNDAFQEADTTGITRPITKYNLIVKRVEDLGRTVKEAFHIARTGRPGPVLVDLPVDITATKCPVEPDLAPDLPGYKPPLRGHMRQIEAAAQAINAAERPLFYVGGGVISADASDELRALAEKGNIPVTTTLLGMGAIDEASPLALKMLGMHGTACANYAVQDTDCLIAVGARFDDRVTGRLDSFAPNAKIIHIDVDPASISNNVDVDIPVVGDARNTLSRMLERIQPRDRSAWLARIDEWRRKHPLRYATQGHIKPQEVIDILGKLTNHNAIIATGVGQHQMWTAQYYGWRRPRQIITSGGLGTMGFGVPAAIGAQFGNPRKTVIDIDGDGSFSMTMVEVLTAVRYQQPVRFVVLDNNYLGMVRQWQEMFYHRRYSAVEHPCPDWAAVAEAFGATGMRVFERSELGDALKEMLDCEGPVVMHVHVDPDENVYPMVAVGKGLHEMDLGKLA
ncbi:MAG: biosynthetic-type acetolactate synthase large subunit [Verrucomicrobia bacterium]|nr:biosynthetic-type acetolactate synthase large subunit [Verrucomicrobiota bacterium]